MQRLQVEGRTPSAQRFEQMAKGAVILVVFPVASFAYLWMARTLAVPSRDFIISARAFPTMVSIGLITSSLWVAVGYLLRKYRARTGHTLRGEVTAPDQSDDLLIWRDVGIAVVLYLAYVLAVDPLGYLLTTPLLITALATIFDKRHVVRNVVVAGLFTAGVQLLFERLLSIPLP